MSSTVSQQQSILSNAIVLAFARVSSASQTASLQTQQQTVTSYLDALSANYEVVNAEIGSVQKGMLPSLKALIQQKHSARSNKRKRPIILAVHSFDRITRSSADIPFLQKYVSCIIQSKQQQQQRQPNHSECATEIILPHEYPAHIALAEAEITAMQQRAIRTSCAGAGTGIVGGSGSTSVKSSANNREGIVPPSLNERIRQVRNKLRAVVNAIQSNTSNANKIDLTEDDHKELQQYICLSQCL